MRRIVDILPSGSYFAAAIATDDFAPEVLAEVVEIYHAHGENLRFRTLAQAERFFDGLELEEPEQASTGAGATTFRDPRTFRGRGPRVERLQKVQVVCRFHDPGAPASVQPGWWYLLASAPWNRQSYSPANSYLNGDPVEGPHLTNVNSGIPVC